MPKMAVAVTTHMWLYMSEVTAREVLMRTVSVAVPADSLANK